MSDTRVTYDTSVLAKEQAVVMKVHDSAKVKLLLRMANSLLQCG